MSKQVGSGGRTDGYVVQDSIIRKQGEDRCE